MPAKLFFVLPFRVNLNSGRVEKSVVGVVFNLLVGFAYYAFHLKSAYAQMISQEDTNFVTKLIDSYNQYTGCSILMLIIVNSCYFQSSIVRVVEHLQTVDTFLYGDDSGIENPGIASQFLLKFHIPSYLFVTGLCFMEYYFCIMFIKDRPTYSSYCYLMCYAPLLVHVTTEFVFCALLVSITDRLYLLQQQPAQCPSIRDSKRAFDELRKALRLLNDSFELPLLLLILHQFTAIVTLTYDLTVAIVKYDFKTPGYDTQKILLQLESSGGWSLFFIAETFVLCLLCHRFSLEFNRAGAWLLKCLSERPESMREHHIISPGNRWTQLQIVAQTRDPDHSITACGLLRVDLQLFYNMIGVITTYLIILVQFDVAQRGETIASSTT